MTRTRGWLFVASLLLSGCAVTAGCGSPAEPTQDASASASPSTASAVEITIDVAPNVLNIQSEGQVVTIHTSLAYGSVTASSVSVNGVTISSSKADNQGQFVAKFEMTAIKSLPLKIGELNTLKIEGRTTAGTPFWGTKAVLVVNNAAGA